VPMPAIVDIVDTCAASVPDRARTTMVVTAINVKTSVA